MKAENIIIIGGGPAGLAGAVYLARAFLKPLVIAGSPPGGQLINTSEVENYPGFESILGPDLIEKYRKHAKKFGTQFIDENVLSVDFLDTNNLKIKLNNNKEHTARAILIATGASATWLGLDSEQRLRGKGVSACATCDGFFFKDKIVAVIGGGDTAMEEALALTKFASKVYIIHRRDSFRASKIMQERVFNNKKIDILWNSKVEEVLGKDKVIGIRVKTSGNKPIKQLNNGNILKIDGLFLAIGHKPNTIFLKDSGVILDKKGYVKTSALAAWEVQKNKKLKYKIPDFKFNYQYSTNIPGVFAAGDCVDYIYRQAATAVGSGVSAALDIEKYLSGLLNKYSIKNKPIDEIIKMENKEVGLAMGNCHKRSLKKELILIKTLLVFFILILKIVIF